MKKQHGFSLVELMIALVLGLVVGGAVLQSFILNNKSIVFQRASITTQDQGRVAMDMLARFIRMAGYQENDLMSGNLSNGLDGSENGALDSLIVRYQAGSTMSSSLYDCVGTELTTASSGSISTNEFKLISDDNGMYNLVCDNGTTSGTLASNIEQFNILYGIDTDSDQAPNLYLSYTAASDSLSSVVAVKACMVIASADNMISSVTSFNDFCVAGTPTVSDKRIRRRVGSTITLRNRAAGSN